MDLSLGGEPRGRMSEESANGGASKAKNALLSGAKSGAFAAASGGITLLRAIQSIRRGDRKRAVGRLLASGFWFGVAGVQRRSGGSDGGVTAPFDGDVDQRDVADTTPDIGDVATDADEGTGPDSPGDPSDVVDTTTVDIDESDTAIEHDRDPNTDPADAVDTTTADIDESDTATEFDGDTDANDIDQRDVTGTNIGADDAQRAAEPGDKDDVQDMNAVTDADPGHDGTEAGNVADDGEADIENARVVDEETETEADAGGDDEDEETGPKSLDDDLEPVITEGDEEEE